MPTILTPRTDSYTAIQLLPSKKDAIAGVITARTGRMRRKTSGKVWDVGLTHRSVEEQGIPAIPAETVTNQRTSSFKYAQIFGFSRGKWWRVQNHLGSDDTTSGILRIISIGAFLILILVAVQLR